MRNVVATLAGILAMGTLVAAQAATAEAGKQVYATQKCATCHQIAGTGGKLASALDGVGSKLKEAEIRHWLTDPAPLEAKVTPKPKMPMSGFLKTHKLSDADVNALTAYMMSLKK